MAKNNYLILFLTFLGLTIILAIILLFKIATPVSTICSEEKTCPTCETCPEEKALMEGVLNSWGENIYDSSENLIEVDVTNYGYKEGKNVEVTCKIYNADEDGVIIGDSAVETVKKSIGNVASTSYKQVELSVEDNIKFGETPIASCFISNCDDCEILYNRIPDLIEGYSR